MSTSNTADQPACTILYRDDYLVAIDKPPGLLSVPGRGPDRQDCAAARLQALVDGASVVHRLDCATSGVMLFAIGADMQRALSRLFHDREVNKKYIALVEGRVSDHGGTINIAMRGEPSSRPRQVIDEVRGKAAITHWRLLSRGDAVSRLLLQPETGRTHQLRLHCMAIGHTIIGDRLYNPDAHDRSGGRLMLHASSLRFTHPATGLDMKLQAACEF